ncbi:hypothetical protein [Sphingomonas sp. T9W2]|uniref:hypothetical protein n=1 Tax=Sphingomonas sp. T9W2 TaxID=3143183 RepID=UPI0031F58AB0
MASFASIGSATVAQRADSLATPAARTRLRDIDGLRGLIVLLMLRIDTLRLTAALAVFGGAPMFFFLFHLTILHIVYHSAAALWDPGHSFDNYRGVILWHFALLVPLYLPTAWFLRLKWWRRDIPSRKYF